MGVENQIHFKIGTWIDASASGQLAIVALVVLVVILTIKSPRP